MAEDSCNANGSAAEVIFNEALRMPAEERGEYLTKACRDDSRLRARVEALLRAAEAPEGFLPEQAGAGPRLDLGGAGSGAVPAEEKPGDSIGRYRLVHQIGQGGFGVVYLAEQSEPVKRRVALKIIKLGMDTRQVVARFEAERQALALMDHPNIAKILDAGATDTGRPYFVMELVEGIKITDYCEKEHLATRERLNLFIQVCRAIQHAHQKGIIHRDIKPSNVLVTLQDGVAVPKVIDFGIAKATQKELAEQTAFTQFRQFVGTPAYMSPEQADLSGLDVDTRSDVYSLGALLYELLTGKTPFETKELLAAGLEEMRRAICEKEPPTPSTRLNQERLAARSAGAGKSETRTPNSEIDKDLDWIVMKCLEKDRRRRYETVNGLAMDIQRHLNNEPVVAGPPTKLYRLKKLVRRNKLVFGAGAALGVVLLVGVLVSTVEAVRARRAEGNEAHQRDKAQTEAAKSQQVARLLEEMLQGVGPSVALGRDTTMLREILDKTAARVGNELTNQPEVQLELLDTLADVYRELRLDNEMEKMAQESLRLARAHFGPKNAFVARALHRLGTAQAHRGNHRQAEATHREALAIRRELFGNENADVAVSLTAVANECLSQGRLAEAETLHREALGIRRKLFGEHDAAVSQSLHNLASVLQQRNQLAEAEAMYRQSLALDRKIGGDENPTVAITLNNLAPVLISEGKLTEAEAMSREALAMSRKFLSEEHPNVGVALNNLAGALERQGKLAEAEANYREALEALRKRLGEDHPDVAVALNNLAVILNTQGKLAEAESLQLQALAIERKAFTNEHPAVARSLNNLALVYLAQRRLAEAEPLLREALSIRQKVFGPQHPAVSGTIISLASVLEREGKLEESERLLKEQLIGQRVGLPPDDLQLGATIAALTTTLLSEGKFVEAEPLGREYLRIREKKSPEDPRTFGASSVVGATLLGQKKYAEAEPLLVSGYEGMKQREARIPAAGKPMLKEALQRLVQLYEETGRPDQAGSWKQKLAEFEQAQTNQPPSAGGAASPTPVSPSPKQ